MNGFIQPQIQTGGGLNEYGEPIPETTDWGEMVECRYFANTLSSKGRYQGERFTQSAYEITVDEMDFEATIIRLLDSRENEVCQKEVISLEVLEDIQRVKITV